MRRILTVCALVLAGVALVGCRSGGSEPSDSIPTALRTQDASPPSDESPRSLPDPCTLLSKTDAELLARTPVADAASAPNSCSYTGPVSGPVAQVEVYVGDGAKKMLDIDRDELAHSFTEVPDIGEEALMEDGTIFFRKGAVWVAIRLVRLNDPAENVAPLVAAARTAAARM